MLTNVIIHFGHLPVPVWASAGFVTPWLWAILFTLEWFAPPMLIAALILEKVKPRYWWGLVAFAFYGLTWVPLDVVAFFTRGDHSWFHTTHKQAVAVSDK
jgi:hypothetical protein